SWCVAGAEGRSPGRGFRGFVPQPRPRPRELVMVAIKRWLAFLLLVPVGMARGQETPSGDLPGLAEHLAGPRPSGLRALGLAEVRRAAGQGATALEELARAADATGDDRQCAAIRDALGWRLLPLGPA